MDREIQQEPFKFRPCGEYEVTLKQIIQVTHGYTEILQIDIVRDWWSEEDLPKGCKQIPSKLSENVFGTSPQREGHGGHGSLQSEEVKRILKYYGDCPCWNLVTRIHNTDWLGVVPVLEVHIRFSDIRASFIQERQDMQKEKARKSHRKGARNEKG